MRWYCHIKCPCGNLLAIATMGRGTWVKSDLRFKYLYSDLLDQGIESDDICRCFGPFPLCRRRNIWKLSGGKYCRLGWIQKGHVAWIFRTDAIAAGVCLGRKCSDRHASFDSHRVHGLCDLQSKHRPRSKICSESCWIFIRHYAWRSRRHRRRSDADHWARGRPIRCLDGNGRYRLSPHRYRCRWIEFAGFPCEMNPPIVHMMAQKNPKANKDF